MRIARCAIVVTTAIALVTWSAPAVAVVAPVASTFDTDLDGWTLFPPPSPTATAIDPTGCPIPVGGGTLTWAPDGGNPGGFALFKDGGPGLSYIKAPQKFLGDWSALNGKGALSWDHRVILAGGAPVYPLYQAIITGPAGAAVYNYRPPPLMGPLDASSTIPISSPWVHINAPLIQASVLDPTVTMPSIFPTPGWRVTPGTSWDKLLSDVTGLYLRIEMFYNPLVCASTDGATTLSPSLFAYQPSPDTIAGDVNSDGQVSVGDLGIVASNYGKLFSAARPAAGDINCDGQVSIGDLGILAANYGWRIWTYPQADGIDNVILSPLAITPAPEPAPALLVLAAAGLVRRRR